MGFGLKYNAVQCLMSYSVFRAGQIVLQPWLSTVDDTFVTPHLLVASGCIWDLNLINNILLWGIILCVKFANRLF
jgi:hypothetical protein